MTNPDVRRSRTAWPGPPSVIDPALARVAQRVKTQGRVIVVLTVCVLVTAVSFLLIFLDRGKLRAEKDAQIEEEVRDSWCLALDSFPAGVPSLDRLRDRHGCGPGIPFEDLTPGEQNRLRGDGGAEPTEPQSLRAPSPPAPFRGGAVGPPAAPSESFRPN